MVTSCTDFPTSYGVYATTHRGILVDGRVSLLSANLKLHPGFRTQCCLQIGRSGGVEIGTTRADYVRPCHLDRPNCRPVHGKIVTVVHGGCHVTTRPAPMRRPWKPNAADSRIRGRIQSLRALLGDDARKAPSLTLRHLMGGHPKRSGATPRNSPLIATRAPAPESSRN